MNDMGGFEQTGWSNLQVVVHGTTGQRFVCKSARPDWHEYDDIEWNPFDTEVSVFMKLATAASCEALVVWTLSFLMDSSVLVARGLLKV